MEESKASVEAMYAAALEETRREGEETREMKARRKKSNKKRGGKRIKKRQSKNEEETGGRVGVLDYVSKKMEEGILLSLEGLILAEEEEGGEAAATATEEEEEEEEDDCAICLGPMDDEGEDEDDLVCQLQCSHEFHRSCVEHWTSTCNHKGLSLTCPTCRRPLVLE